MIHHDFPADLKKGPNPRRKAGAFEVNFQMQIAREEAVQKATHGGAFQIRERRAPNKVPTDTAHAQGGKALNLLRWHIQRQNCYPRKPAPIQVFKRAAQFGIVSAKETDLHDDATVKAVILQISAP
jgi:hypothetical protein